MNSLKISSDLLTAIIKTYKMNVRHSFESCEMTKGLKICLEDTKYARHAGEFVIKSIRSHGRRYKCLHLVSENSGSLIPLTKTKLKSCFQPGTVGRSITRANVLAAMRAAIADQIDEFRAERRCLTAELVKKGYIDLARELARCPLTGNLMAASGTHVDHVVPFIQLADMWLESQTNYNKFKEVPAKRTRSGIVLEEHLKNSWADFHRAHATLQLTSAKANIKKSSGSYRSTH